MNINVSSRISRQRMFNFQPNTWMKSLDMKLFLPVVVLIAGCLTASGQNNPLSRYGQRGMGGAGGKDSLEHRKEDTITITFRYLDSSRLQKIDSEVYNFYLRYPVPPTYVDFGNLGTASHDLVFHPYLKPGWDGGWHAYDPFVYTIEGSKFYNTTKPYSELGYLIGSHAEQMINLQHTQNITRNWNAFFQYRLINSPGTYSNQVTDHNSYR